MALGRVQFKGAAAATFGFLTFSELEVHTATAGTAAVLTRLAPSSEQGRLEQLRRTV